MDKIFPELLINIWKENKYKIEGWQVNMTNFSFIQFTKEKKILYLDSSGKTVTEFDFYINSNSEIILPKEQVFGKIVKLESDVLNIEIKYNIAKEDTSYSKTKIISYLAKDKTNTDLLLPEVKELFSRNKWKGELSENKGRKLSLFIQNSNKVDFPLELNFVQFKDDKKQEHKALGKIVHFDGSYTIEYKMNSFVNSLETFPICKISTKEITLESPNQNKINNIALQPF